MNDLPQLESLILILFLSQSINLKITPLRASLSAQGRWPYPILVTLANFAEGDRRRKTDRPSDLVSVHAWDPGLTQVDLPQQCGNPVGRLLPEAEEAGM